MPQRIGEPLLSSERYWLDSGVNIQTASRLSLTDTGKSGFPSQALPFGSYGNDFKILVSNTEARSRLLPAPPALTQLVRSGFQIPL